MSSYLWNDTNKQTALHLLDNITIIRNKYDEIAKITGENFNIFKIFGKEYHENYHSAIISDLLNEKGSHGQGRLFLDLFLQIINKRIIDEKLNRTKSGSIFNCNEIIDFTDSLSITEKVIDDFDRIDIYLSSKNQNIVIENKIGAPFQNRQLKRYYDYAIKGKDFVILYLWKKLVTFDEAEFNNEPWPFGKPDENPNEVKAKTISISYGEDIKDWIELSIKECSKLPLIRETLIQYLNTINKITEQSTNTKMGKDIRESIIGNNGNINKEMIKTFFELKKIQLEPTILDMLVKRLDLSGKFEYIRFKKEEFTGKDFEITIGKVESNYDVRVYFSSITEPSVIGVFKKNTQVLKNNGYKETDNIDIDKQKNNLTDFIIGDLLRTDMHYTNWLWLCRFNAFNNSAWEDKLSEEFYLGFETAILNVYENVIK